MIQAFSNTCSDFHMEDYARGTPCSSSDQELSNLLILLLWHGQTYNWKSVSRHLSENVEVYNLTIDGS